MNFQDLRQRFEGTDSISFNLMVCDACNFSCGHCMFACGPKPRSQTKWMSTQDLDDIIALAVEMREKTSDGANISFNIIGGEPSLDMEKLEGILEYLRLHPDSTHFSMEMTTNGWWLRSWAALCRFARTMGPSLEHWDMSIRISNTRYHEAFRTPAEKSIIIADPPKRSWSYERKPSRLESVLEMPFEHYEIYGNCPECGEELGGNYCSKCERELTEDEYAEAQDKAFAVPGHQWVETLLKAAREERFYVDSRNDNLDKISPVGRALSNGIGFQDVDCWSTNRVIFTFLPGARVQGICCTGGYVPLGHARDGAWPLIVMADQYSRTLQQKHGRDKCRECSAFAAGWLKRNRARLLTQTKIQTQEISPLLAEAA